MVRLPVPEDNGTGIYVMTRIPRTEYQLLIKLSQILVKQKKIKEAIPYQIAKYALQQLNKELMDTYKRLKAKAAANPAPKKLAEAEVESEETEVKKDTEPEGGEWDSF